MKKLIPLLFIVGLCFTFISTSAQTPSAQEKSVSGAWVSQDGKEFTMMNNGFFSSVSADSAGVWNQTHAGSYTIDNANTITFKVLYSSFPDHIGALNTVEYNIKDGAITMKWFKKLVDAKGVDITAQVPKDTQTTYVRAKK
jgi:hypothetical protein